MKKREGKINTEGVRESGLFYVYRRLYEITTADSPLC